MIKKMTIQSIAEGGDAGFFKLDSGLYWVGKVSSVEKIDIPIREIRFNFKCGGYASLDYSDKTDEERDRDFFEYRRVITF